MAARVYLDNCCFNRPFDDQSQARVRLETEAKLQIQQRGSDGLLELGWSYILDYENGCNPFAERRQAVSVWKSRATVDITASPALLNDARSLLARGVRPKDALHIACALAAGCSAFLTTDDLLPRKTRDLATIRVMNPVEITLEAP